MSSQKPLKHYIDVPDLQPANAQWQHIVRARRARRRRPYIALSVVLVLLGTLGVARRFREPTLVPPLGLRMTASAAQTLRLSDGSVVDLEAGTTVEFGAAAAGEQAVVLSSGTVRFAVVHTHARRFVVRAGDVEVLDVGTVFSVSRDPATASVRVSVASGSVELRTKGKDARALHAGESLTTPDSNTVLVPAPALSIAAAPKPESPSPVVVPAAVSPPRGVLTSDALFAKATAARQASEFATEERALEQLLRRYPNDPLTPLAAYELGSVRMDRLSNRKGALVAFQNAVAHGTTSPFRIDAEARIVQLLDELDRADECVAARETFLAAHPKDLHRARVTARCRAH